MIFIFFKEKCYEPMNSSRLGQLHFFHCELYIDILVFIFLLENNMTHFSFVTSALLVLEHKSQTLCRGNSFGGGGAPQASRQDFQRPNSATLPVLFSVERNLRIGNKTVKIQGLV